MSDGGPREANCTVECPQQQADKGKREWDEVLRDREMTENSIRTDVEIGRDENCRGWGGHQG